MALFHLKGDKEQKALDLLLGNLKYDKYHVPSLLALGQFYGNHGQLDQALRYLDQVLKIDAKNTQALFVKGVVLLKQGKRVPAREMFKKVYELDQQNTRARDLFLQLLPGW